MIAKAIGPQNTVAFEVKTQLRRDRGSGQRHPGTITRSIVFPSGLSAYACPAVGS